MLRVQNEAVSFAKNKKTIVTKYYSALFIHARCNQRNTILHFLVHVADSMSRLVPAKNCIMLQLAEWIRHPPKETLSVPYSTPRSVCWHERCDTTFSKERAY